MFKQTQKRIAVSGAQFVLEIDTDGVQKIARLIADDGAVVGGWWTDKWTPSITIHREKGGGEKKAIPVRKGENKERIAAQQYSWIVGA